MGRLRVELVDAGTSVLAVTHDEDFVRALGADVLDLGSPGAPAVREAAR